MPSIDIRLKQSKQLILLILLLLIGSIGIIFSLQILWWVKAILVFVTLGYGLSILLFHGFLLGRNAVLGIRQAHEGCWHLFTNNQAVLGELMGDSTVTTLLCVLRFKIQGEKLKRSCVIFNDSMKADDYRRLLVYLKCYKS